MKLAAFYDDPQSPGGHKTGYLDIEDIPGLVADDIASTLQSIVIPIDGVLALNQQSIAVPLPGLSGTIYSVKLKTGVGEGPVGDALLVDVLKSGNSIFATEQNVNVPFIATGGFISPAFAPLVRSYVDGDYLTAQVLRVGSGTPGSNLRVLVELIDVELEVPIPPTPPDVPPNYTAFQRLIHDVPSTVAYWRMNEASGVLMNDDVGNYDGTYAGAVTLGTTSLLATETDTALTSFNPGVGPPGMWIDVPSLPLFTGNDPFTFEGWYKPSVVDGNFRRVFDQLTAPSGGTGYTLINVTQPTGPGFYFQRSIAGANVVCATTTQPANTMFFWRVTYDGATIKLYVDGTLLQSVADARSMPVATPTFRIGHFQASGSPASGGQGVYDEFVVYDAALDAASAAEHYIVGSGNVPPPPPPLPPEELKRTFRSKYSKVALYASLNETSGTTVVAQKKRLLFFEKAGWVNGQLTSSTPVDLDTQNYHGQLWGQASSPGTAFNTGTFSKPVYIADADVSHIKVADTDGYMNQDNSIYKWGSGTNVAWNEGWRAADAELSESTYRDRHIILVDPTYDRMTEIFGVYHFDTGPGTLPHRWDTGVQAVHGGKIDGLSTFSGAFPSPFGASGTSLSILAGLIRYEEILQSEIPHAIAFATSKGTPGFLAPATRGDQNGTTGNRFPEGGILRINPAFDIHAWVVQQKASILTELAALAVQKYGMFCMDASGAVSFYGEDIRNPVTGQYDASYNNTLWFPYMVSEAAKTNITGNSTTNIITSPNHGISNGGICYLYNLVGGAGLVTTRYYYVVSSTSTTFQLSLTSGGAAIDFTTDITGGQVGRVQAQYEIFNSSRFPWGQLQLMVPPATTARLPNTWNDLTGTHSGAVTVGQSSLTTNTASKSTLYAGGKTTFADDPVFDVGAACTIRAITKTTTVAAGEAIIAHRDVYELKRSGSSLIGSVTIGGVVKSVTATSVFTANTLADVALTYDGANVKLWSAGVQVGSSTAATGSVDASSDVITLGSLADTTKAFSGQLQHVEVLQEALSAARLLADYTAITT